jgi:hypothetical protein
MTTALDVTCPYCGAAPGNFCKTVNGTTRPAHAARKESAMAAPEKHPVFYTSFAGTSSVILTRDMELSQDSAQHSIGAATVLGYSIVSLRVTGRDGSHRRLVATLRGGQVSSVYDFVDTFCGSTPPDYV